MKRNKFNLSHYRLLTGDMGNLLPIGSYEVLPGDTIQHSTSMLIRVQELVAPLMHPVFARIHNWFVPFTEIWEDFEPFITGGPDGNDTSVHPTMAFTGAGLGQAAKNDLAAHLRVPIGVDATVSALPFRAYAKIWNDHYRDQDLQTALTVDVTSGVDAATNITLQNICWEKDRFTSARPWTQKGADVSMPIAGDATIKSFLNADCGSAQHLVRKTADDTLYTGSGNLSGNAGDASLQGGADAYLDPNGRLYADLATATGPDINEMREAFALQRYKEARARYGSRYTEYLRYLGVSPADSRLGRAEFLSGSSRNIQFSEVLQTGVDTSGTPKTGLGAMAGHGLGAMRSNRFRKFFTEHGIVISLLSIRPKTMYFEGIPKDLLRTVKEDYFQKELQLIGQDEVLNKEIYTAHASPEAVFGYQDRYDEYRRCESGVSGDFMDSLKNYFHMARDFSADPTLNASFVSSVPTTRVYQNAATDQVYVMANHSIQARRMLAKTGAARNL